LINKSSKFGTAILPGLLVILAAIFVFYKTAVLGFDFSKTKPRISYFLETVIEFDGHGSPVEISLSLPENLSDQRAIDESFQSSDLKFSLSRNKGDRRGVWYGDNVSGKYRLSYTGTILRDKKQFIIDPTIATTEKIPPEIAANLLPDETIQSDDPQIESLADSLGLSPDSTILFNLTRIFDYVAKDLKYVSYSGTTDALTAHALGEASCGGKSRLMAALARYLGIPARLVGGKIMTAGQSHATHIWLETYIKNQWVPFCPTNNYFAEIPDNYLILYYGEKPFVTHTKDINFKYYFHVKKRLLMPSNETLAKASASGIFSIWEVFERAAISIELLRIIIMLPIGILIIVIFRNIVGLETFGTFMPALIAIGFRETGLLDGLILFSLIITFGALVRSVVNRFQLLHTPRLATILFMVITFMLGLAVLGTMYGYAEFSRVALFPLVILTLTVERFCIISEEFGFKESVRILVFTMIVASTAYLFMSWRELQIIMINFPELLLIVVALYIYLGRYSGFRLSELLRFKTLLKES